MTSIVNTYADLDTIIAAIDNTQPEADVFIVLLSSTGMRRFIPYWESTSTPSTLLTEATASAAIFAEQIGQGFVDWFILDRRTLSNDYE